MAANVEDLGFITMEGTPGVDLREAAHVFLPGRGRSADGMGLSAHGADRVLYGGRVFRSLVQPNGVIVCSGYKTPGDKNGELWSCDEVDAEGGSQYVYTGKPEAYSGAGLLIATGIGRFSVCVEPDSICSVTNLARSRELFPDDRPVAIVAQEEHLERFVKLVAPKTLRQDFIGVVVPENPDDRDADSFFARMATRATLLGPNASSPNLIGRTDRRSRRIWAAVLAVQGVRAKVLGESRAVAIYQTPGE